MILYARRALGAHLRASRSLYALTVLGVALGVASVLTIQIINRNALAAFEGGLQAVSGDADLSVLGRTPTLPDSVYPAVLATPGVRAAWPMVRFDVALDGRTAFFLDVVGFDIFAPVRVPWSDPPADIGAALTTPGWAAVTPELAAEMRWRVGSTFRVSSGSRAATLTVGALVDFKRLTPLASRKLVVMDIAQSQALLGQPGRITQVDVQAAEGTAAAELAARLGRRLGPAVQVLTPEQRTSQATGLLGAFRLNLTALSLISLFVGLFLVHTSTRAALVRRRMEFGLLRSLGATSGQVFALILGEAALLGTLGVLVGIPLGYAAARANVAVVSATLTNLYLLEGIERLTLPAWLYALAAAIGIGGAVLGSVLPALDVSRRDTKSLLAAFTLHERLRSVAWPLATAGALVIAASALWFWAFGRAWRPGGFVLGVGLLVGLPLFTPLVVRAVSAGVPSRGFGLRYAVRGLGAQLSSTTFAVAALGVAVSMLIGITMMIGSFRRTVELWVGRSVRADVYISAASFRSGGNLATLDDSLVAALVAYPGVRAADRLRGQFVWAGTRADLARGGRRINVGGVDAALEGGIARFPLLRGDQERAIRALREGGAVLVGETLYRKAGLDVGDSLFAFGPRGVLAFPIAGVFYDYTTEGGSAAMDLATFAAALGSGPITNVALYLRPGADAERVVDALKARYTGQPLVFRSNRDLREEIFRIFDQTFAVTRILQGMSLLIAACGITLTLLVLARERLSELALYRALGAGRRQIFRVFVGKGLGMGALGLVLGAVGGLALAAILIFVINRAYFGWTIRLHWPWAALGQQAATILAAAALASLYPALRASRTPATDLSRDDL